LTKTAQLSLVKRASALECELERLEGKLSRDIEVDPDIYEQLTGHLRRWPAQRLVAVRSGCRRSSGRSLGQI
jgi:hypothetical protein